MPFGFFSHQRAILDFLVLTGVPVPFPDFTIFSLLFVSIIYKCQPSHKCTHRMLSPEPDYNRLHLYEGYFCITIFGQDKSSKNSINNFLETKNYFKMTIIRRIISSTAAFRMGVRFSINPDWR